MLEDGHVATDLLDAAERDDSQRSRRRLGRCAGGRIHVFEAIVCAMPEALQADDVTAIGVGIIVVIVVLGFLLSLVFTKILVKIVVLSSSSASGSSSGSSAPRSRTRSRTRRAAVTRSSVIHVDPPDDVAKSKTCTGA